MNENTNDEFYAKIDNIINAYEQIISKIRIVLIIISSSAIIYKISSSYLNYSKLRITLIELIETQQGIILSTSIIFIFGVILTIFKFKQQFWYGVFETIFSIVSCSLVLKNLQENSSYLDILIVIASVLYLVVRGLSNINDGYKKIFWMKKEFISFTLSTKDFSKSKLKLQNAFKDRKLLFKILDFIARTITGLH